MTRFLVFAIAGFSLVATPVSAKRVEKETPKGTDMTVPVGGVVWEKAASDGAPGVTIDAAVHANWGSVESVDLPAGANLITIRKKKLKACRQQTVTRLSGMNFGGWRDCLIDTDSDGRFDRVSFNEVAGAKNILPPVAYTQGTVPIAGGKAQSFKRTITFLGKSGADIRLSYREFANDMARPAFTEALTLPLPPSFPETMVVKDIRLTILGLDGSGLRYRLD